MKEIIETPKAEKKAPVLPPLPQVRSGNVKVISEWVMVAQSTGDISFVTTPGFLESKTEEQRREIYEDYKNAAKLGNYFFKNHNDDSLEHIPSPILFQLSNWFM